jgi:tRNA(fMet)-specific endonuclease VapC
MAGIPAPQNEKAEGEAQVIYVLDTDVFTLSELHDSPEYLRLHARVLQLADDDRIVTTIITYEEQTRGWLAYAAKSRDIRHQMKAYGRLKRHLQTYLGFEVLDFDAAAAEEYERIRKLKLHICSSDMRIAAITLSQNAILLSRNVRDFAKVPDLVVEDWTKP